MSDVSHLLDAAAAGDAAAHARLFEVVYNELRRLAAGRLATEARGHTLDVTALVHEAYVRLGGPTAASRWDSRGHFFVAASEAMRRILIDHARARRAARRGGGRRRVPLGEPGAVLASPDDLLDLNEVLARFAAEEPRKADLVRLRFFAGLSLPEAAEALGVSVATVERWWVFARAWLFAELDGGPEKSPNG